MAPFRKLPRGQLYFEPLRTLLDAARHLPAPLSRGERVDRFESACAQALGAPHAVALPRARLALHYLLQALDLPPGSEVLLTPVTIPDIVNVVLLLGHRPVFVDLAPRTGNVDVDDLARKITPKSKVILFTHLCGMPSDMDRVLPLAEAHGLEVLEDCSQAMGARWKGRPVGLFGRAGFFSLTTLKPLSTFHGGLTITREEALDRRLRELTRTLPAPDRMRFVEMLLRDAVMHLATHPAFFAWATWPVLRVSELAKPELAAQFQRGNVTFSKAKAQALQVERRERLPASWFVTFTDYQAQVGLHALRTLEEGNRLRRERATYLLQLLQQRGVPGLPEVPRAADPTWWRFPLWVEHVAGFRMHMHGRGIDTAQTNLPCLSREPAFAEFAAKLPEAERYVDGMVFLPMHPTVTPRDCERMADAVADYFARGGR